MLNCLRALALLFAAIAVPASAQVKGKESASPSVTGVQVENRLSLDGTWQFALARSPDDSAQLAGFYLPEADLSRFVPITVPSNWAVLGFEEPHYKSFEGPANEGFYRRNFTVPADWDRRRVLLHFDGVWSSAEVWVNGIALGGVDSGFTRISFDVSSAIKPGASNLIVVRVRQVQPSYSFDANDDWSLGGIYRSVSLEAMPQLRWIDRVETRTDFDEVYRDADLKIRVMVGSYGKRKVRANPVPAAERPYQLRLTLFDREGRRVQGQEVAVEPHLETGRETIATLHLQKPLQWTAETPNLYRLSIELLEGGKPVHVRTLSVGLREISTKGGVFRINGQAIKLRGVNRHDEYPDTGRATTPAQWLQDITMMKAANINYVRLAHYPPASGFLDLCDRLGMYVSNEIPMGVGGDTLDDPALSGAVMLRSYETVARDINHPSVVIWSVGNEDPLTSLHLAAIRTVKGLDPTRPVLMPWRWETWLPPEIDILSPHYFSAQKYDELASRADRPIVTTEYAHAYGNDGFGGLDARWKALIRHPSGAGGAIWMWADQGLAVTRRRPDGSLERALQVLPDGFDGITDSYRRPTRDYWETQAVYAPVYPAVDAVDVIVGQELVRVPIRNDYDFTDLSHIGVRWALMEDDRQLANGKAPLSGAPHASAATDLPLAGLKSWNSDSAYYFLLDFVRGDGSIITRRSVELRSATAAAARPSPLVAVAVHQTADRVAVRVGQVNYEFDPRSGQLTAALAGRPLVTALRPTIWRPLNETEKMILKREGTDQNLPDLNRYTPKAIEWRVTQEAGLVAIHSVISYFVDAKNSFTVIYDYTVDATGALNVRYTISPDVAAKWLTHVGMDMQVQPGLNRLRWLGLGPHDAYPNKRAAPVFGLWSAAMNLGTGHKAIRRVDLTDHSGDGVSVQSDGYVSFDAAAPGSIRILSSVLGRSQKNRGPEHDESRLDTGPGKVFVGQFLIRLKD